MTNWGRVYYTNFLSAAALLAVFPFCKGEHELLKNYDFTPPQIMLLALSCAIGVCMSHAGKQLACVPAHSSRTVSRSMRTPTCACAQAYAPHAAADLGRRVLALFLRRLLDEKQRLGDRWCSCRVSVASVRVWCSSARQGCA